MKIFTLISTFLLVISSYSYASPDTEKIIPILKQYATSIGCSFYIDQSNIFTYKFKKRKAIVAMYSLDVGCSGGTAMSRSIFARLDYASASIDKILVNPEFSLPSQTSSEFQSRIEKVYLEGNKIKYSALEHDFLKDALCCPSIRVTGTVELIDKTWVPIPD